MNQIVERPWGSYETVRLETGFQIKKIIVKPKQRLSLQYHNHRSEHWTIVSGIANVQVGDDILFRGPNSAIYIPKKVNHRIENVGDTDLVFIEVQLGDYLGEDDIVRITDDYGR